MAEIEAGEVREAVQTIAQAAGAAEASEAALEAAAERQEELEDAAENIAEAAMEAERMRVVEELRKDTLLWREALQNEMAQIQNRQTELSNQLATLLERLSAPLPVVQVTTEAATAKPLTPAPSEAPATETTVTVNPAAGGDGLPVPETPAASERPRRARFL